MSHTNSEHSRRSSLGESPWFWLYLFATVALIVLLVNRPKIVSRQVQLERNLQARQRAAQVVAGQKPTAPLSEENAPQISLVPLYVLLAVLVLTGWIGLVRSRWNSLKVTRSSANETSTGKANSAIELYACFKEHTGHDSRLE